MKQIAWMMSVKKQNNNTPWASRIKSLIREIADVPPWNNWTLSDDPDVVYQGERAYCRRIRSGSDRYIKKIFCRGGEAIRSYEKEVSLSNLFLRYEWNTPKRETGKTRLGQPYFVVDEYPEESRLDRFAVGLSDEKKFDVALSAMSAVLDLHCNRVAHRDLHARHVFCLSDGVRLIDYDASLSYPAEYRPKFSECYDLTGKGLESPFATNNAGIFCTHISYSVYNVLGVEASVLLPELRRLTAEKLAELTAAESADDDHEAMEFLRNMPVIADGSRMKRVAVIMGSGCLRLVEEARRVGMSLLYVIERDLPSRDALLRWVEANEIDGIELICSEDDPGVKELIQSADVVLRKPEI